MCVCMCVGMRGRGVGDLCVWVCVAVYVSACARACVCVCVWSGDLACVDVFATMAETRADGKDTTARMMDADATARTDLATACLLTRLPLRGLKAI